MAASDVPADWDPLKDHFKTSNVYRANKVVTRRDGSESEASEEKEKDLFVANIPIRITTDGLINLLGAAGKIQEIKLIPDKKNSQNQLGFVKTLSSADGLRIIEQFNNFKIGNSFLRIQVQKPRKVENSSDSGRPPFGQSHAPPPLTQTNSAPPPQPQSSPTASESRSDGARCSSSSPFGDDKMKPVGRSKLILATALRHQSHEPQVGLSRAASTRPTNGSSHRSSGPSGSSSSEEIGSREMVEKKNDKQPESQALVCVNKQPDNSSQDSKNVSENVTPKSQVCKTGPCLKCQKFGDKNCSKCKGVYCSRVCQLADFSVHRLICMPYSMDEEEFQKRFEFSIDSVSEPDPQIPQVSEVQATILQLNVPVKVACLVPAMSPSRFFVLPDSNKNRLDKLTLLLNEHYAVAKNCQKPEISPDVGDVCACKYSADDLWYRVEVEDVVTRSKVIVRYIDYGNEEEVDISGLCELPRQFKVVPKLAVLCGLANIEPIPSDGGSRWSKKAIQLSQKFIQQCIAVINPISVASDACNVEMKIDDPDGTNVAEKLVDAGVARYTEKNRPTRDSVGKLPSPRPSPSSSQLPSPRPSPSPAQLPLSRPSPSPNQSSSSRPSSSPNNLPSSRPSPSSDKLPSSSSLPSPGELPSSQPLLSAKKPVPPVSPSAVELSGFEAPNLSKFGWPVDLSNMVGKQMSFQVVEYSPPGDLWVRIDALPGRETLPLVRLSLTERYRLTPEPRPSSCGSNPPPLTLKPDAVAPVQPKWHRVKVNDLPALQLNTELKVELTLPKNPADFWCHDLEQMAPIMALQNSLKPDDSPLPRSFQPEYGDMCFGLYKKYNEWYRVMVLERKSDSVDAFLIDYGENISIPLSDLRPLPLELSLYAPMAFQCQLSVWKSLQTSSCDVIKHFQDLVQSKAVSCKIVGHNAVTGMRSVVLSDFQSGQSIASVLIDAIEKNGF